MQKILLVLCVLFVVLLSSCIGEGYAELQDYVETTTECVDLYDPQYVQPKYFIK